MTESPAELQQDTKSENLGEVIAETFDAMESEDSVEEQDDAQVEILEKIHEGLRP